MSSFTGHEADLYGTRRLSEDLLKEEKGLRDILDLLTWSDSAPMSIDLISYLLGMPNDGALAGSFALGAELRLLQRSEESESPRSDGERFLWKNDSSGWIVYAVGWVTGFRRGRKTFLN